MVSYLQLAHNERHPRTGSPVAKVIHNFGRADLVDREALARLVASISRFLDPEQAAAAAAGGEVEVLDSRRLGGAWMLDRMWERLEIGAAIRRVAAGRRLDGEAVERVIFALVAQRALEPASKLAATRWVAERVFIEGCPGFSDDAAYRAMDFLLDALDEIAAEIFYSVAHLLNLDLDIVFVDTTSTYWEIEIADELAEAGRGRRGRRTACPTEEGARLFGHSKDHRDDLPQVVIAMAVTRDGIPVRCWTFPGDTADTAIIRTVKDDLGGWDLRRLVWVADRGFASAANRAYLTRGGGHYIHAEKLRHTNTEAAAALARPGRYRTVADNLRVKEVGVARPGTAGTTARAQRFVICHNPEQAERDQQVRDQPRRAPAKAHRRLRCLDRAAPRRTRRQPQDQAGAAPLPAPHPAPGCCASTRPRSSARRTWTASGCCAPPTPRSPPTTSPPPTSSCSPSSAAGATSRARCGLRPVFHYREDRIRAHIQLCWLALLLLRVDRERHRRHLAQHPPRTRPDAPGHPGHRRRPGRPTLRDHPRPADHAARPRPARTAQVLRLHPPHRRLTSGHAAARRVVTRPDQAIMTSAQVTGHFSLDRLPTICGSPV